MKTVAFGVFAMTMALSPAHAVLELQLTTRLQEQLPYLRPDMRLEVVNPSSDSILFPMNAFHVRLFLDTEDGWRECRPLVVSKPAPLSEVDWKPLNTEESFDLSIPGSRCAEGRGTWFEWANQPGTHRVKAKITTFAHKVGVPPGAFDGVLESNVLEFRIKEPVGVDAEAIAWAGGSPMKVELLGEFPTSEYAAFFVYGQSRRIDKIDPVETRSLIERGLFPGRNSVPNGDGWKSLNNEGYARWLIEWGELVLREHPDFPFRDDIKTSVALAQMSLGEQTPSLEALTDIAEKGSAEVAAWARAFLDAKPRE